MSVPRHLSRLERVLGFVEAMTIGLPFCVFKIVAGALILQLDGPGWIAWALIALGALDAVVNAINAVAVVALGTRPLPLCVFDILLVRKREDLGPALDVMLSFTLVAVMIGGGYIAALPSSLLRIWNLAVVCNVLGAGALRVSQAALRRSPTP